jgi:hypothetical protein
MWQVNASTKLNACQRCGLILVVKCLHKCVCSYAAIGLRLLILMYICDRIPWRDINPGTPGACVASNGVRFDERSFQSAT